MSENITNNPSVPSQVVAEVKFPRFINNLGIIPTSYKDSMDYYETLAWLCNYLEKTVIPTVNQNGEAVQELQALYIQLNDYVSHYFDNLDVQEEINNKLDDMVEQGTLQEIIGAYLDANALWCFDSVNDMKDATNLVNGSYAKTLGFYEKNDEGGATYKIRTITNDDVIDNALIIALNDEENQLIAELITNEKITPEMFGAKGDGVTDDTEAIQKALDTKIPLYFSEKTYVITDTLTMPTSSSIIGVTNESKYTEKNYGTIIKITNDLTNGIEFGILSQIKNITIDCNNNEVSYALLPNQNITKEANALIEKVTICNNPAGNGFYIGKINSANQGFNNIINKCVARDCLRGFFISNTDNTLSYCEADSCTIGCSIGQNQNTLINCMFFNSKTHNLRVLYCAYCNIFGGSSDNYSQSSSTSITESTYIDHSNYINFYGMRFIGGTESNIKITNSNMISFNECMHEIETGHVPNYFYKAEGTNSKLVAYNPKYNASPNTSIGTINIIKIEDIMTALTKTNITVTPSNNVTIVANTSFEKNKIGYVNIRLQVTGTLESNVVATLSKSSVINDYVFLNITSVTSGINLGMCRLSPLSNQIQAFLQGSSNLSNGDYVITGVYSVN